jgi:hypothetical protein
MSEEKTEMSFGTIVLLIAIVLFMIGALFNNNSGGSSGSSASSNTGSSNYRYAKERFRQEGLSDSEASEAASAVIKFHEAQKNRNGY